jgi:hypothetical protein
MLLVYAIILTCSTAFAAGVFVRIHERLAPLLHRQHTPIGALIAFPMLGFMSVVMVPAPVICAATLALFIGWRDDTRGLDRSVGLALLLLVAAVGLMGIHPPSAFLWPAPLTLLVFWLVWWGFTLSAGYLPREMASLLPTATFALAPLIAAPLWSNAPTSIAVDAGLLLSALLGAFIAARGNHRMALSLCLPLTVMVGFCILRAFAAGAWVFALLSLVLWVTMAWHHARK